MTTRRLLAALFPFVLAGAALGCAETPEPVVPTTPPPPPNRPDGVPSAEAFAITAPVREESLPLLKPPVITPAKSVLVAPPAGLPPAPAACGAFAARKAAGACPAGDARELLSKAMDEGDAGKRDQLLANLETCATLPLGFARAIRGELAPAACGEAIQEPFIRVPPASITPAVYHALLGQAVAARLARAGTNPPKLAAPYDKARVAAFTKGPLLSWFTEQAKVVQELSQSAAELPYYAQAITAIEAGMADMRLVEAVRAAPIPTEFEKDAEWKNTYYASLDQLLDPRKDRGRDAALVGLKQFAIVGSLTDPRVAEARRMLARLYGGRRIDALDALSVPALAPASPSTVEERLAAQLPTFYAGVLLDEKTSLKPGVFRQLAERGVPLPVRVELAKGAIADEIRGLYARAKLSSARLYWRAVDVDQAAVVASKFSGSRPEDATLVLAIAIALRNGPEDASQMMRKTPVASPGQANVAALDMLSRGQTFPGAAAFDAALVRQVTTPQGAPATYFQDVARRFREAEKLLTDAKDKAAAAERARAAEETAAAVR